MGSPMEEAGTAMPLAMAVPGQRVKILAVRAGRGLQARLSAMGLVPGVEVMVVGNDFRGPLFISVGGGRLMLGRGMTQKILVG